jgi:hypothetical protein
MNSKKIFIACLIIVIAASSISLISATTQETINGINFTIPDGYVKSDDVSIVADMFLMEVYENPDGKTLSFRITPGDSHSLDNLKKSGYVDKTIANKQGMLYKGWEKVTFAYMDGDKLVKIIAPDEATVEIVLS